MQDDNNTAADLFSQINDSAGMRYLNRAHQRSFSLNVFQMNAVELIEAVYRVKDPDQGIALMAVSNKEAGRQAHRELNRHVHNFVASAFTLVEHTRGFMRKHYADTQLFTSYEKQVAATFANSAIAQFVQGLRNYMVHKGLPPSSMFMTFTSNPEASDGSGTAETGVRYDTSALLEWEGWNTLARGYLQKAGANLDVGDFAQEYVTLINRFHGWLDSILASHHQSDIEELGLLQAQLHGATPTTTPRSKPAEVLSLPPLESFEITSTQAGEIDRLAESIFANVRQLRFQHLKQGFLSERPSIKITDSELAGPITFWGHEVGGGAAFMFIQHEGKDYGLSESEHGALTGLSDEAMKCVWIRKSLSHEFVRDTFVNWARERFSKAAEGFAGALSRAARRHVAAIEVWAPIGYMEVEEAFDFGPVRIEPITEEAMASFRSHAPVPRPEQAQQVEQLFARLQRDIQGFAAVVVCIEAEPNLAHQRAIRIAQDAVTLLRFFSPAARRSFQFNPVALSGVGHVPTSKLVLLSDNGFQLREERLPKHVGYWQLSKRAISALGTQNLAAASSLVLPEGLDEFASAVREGLYVFSSGTTLADPRDRLRHALLAVEGVLLKHEMEPRSHVIANRMSFLLSPDTTDREEISLVVRQAYWLQGQPRLTSRNPREEQLIVTVTSYVYDALLLVLGNIATFSSKTQFLLEVDRLGLNS